jgi:hypothetical protein
MDQAIEDMKKKIETVINEPESQAVSIVKVD